MKTFDPDIAEVLEKSNPKGYNQYTGAGGSGRGFAADSLGRPVLHGPSTSVHDKVAVGEGISVTDWGGHDFGSGSGVTSFTRESPNTWRTSGYTLSHKEVGQLIAGVGSASHESKFKTHKGFLKA